MKKITKELLGEFTEEFKKYAVLMDAKADLTKDNRALKSDFISINFEDDEDVDQKALKNQITKYFRAVDEIGSGKDYVVEVKPVRKDHMGLSEELYTKLMKTKEQIDDNIERKDSIDSKVENLIRSLVPKMDASFDVLKGILAELYKFERGKDTRVFEIVDGYRILRKAIDVGVEA